MAVQWTGLDAFLDELRDVGSALTAEASAILSANAEAAKTAIAAAYPVQTGKLQQGLVVRRTRGSLVAGVLLVQTAPHGHLYEYGTQERQNKAGANRGRMPAHPTFKPLAATHRQTALQAVIDRLKSYGATRVTGDVT